MISFYCLQDEGSFQMKPPARDVLTQLGSDKARTLGWRDTWVLVTIKGGKHPIQGQFRILVENCNSLWLFSHV